MRKRPAGQPRPVVGLREGSVEDPAARGRGRRSRGRTSRAAAARRPRGAPRGSRTRPAGPGRSRSSRGPPPRSGEVPAGVEREVACGVRDPGERPPQGPSSGRARPRGERPELAGQEAPDVVQHVRSLSGPPRTRGRPRWLAPSRPASRGPSRLAAARKWPFANGCSVWARPRSESTQRNIVGRVKPGDAHRPPGRAPPGRSVGAPQGQEVEELGARHVVTRGSIPSFTRRGRACSTKA